MDNPLNLKETRIIAGALYHDVGDLLHAHLMGLRIGIGTLTPELKVELGAEKSLEKIDHFGTHLTRTLGALASLSEEKMQVNDIPMTELEHLLMSMVEGQTALEQIPYGKVKLEFNSSGVIHSNLNLLYAATFNLYKNARQQTLKEGRIKIELSDFSGRPENIVPRSQKEKPGQGVNLSSPIIQSEKGDYLEIKVNDTGPGLTKNKLLNLLTKGPFPEGRRGLGLFYVARICEYLDAYLSVDSMPGNTNFTIYHPLTKSHKLK